MTTLLAHEWLAPIGGSENVVERMLLAIPDVDLLCLWNDAPERFGDQVSETWLARTPLRRSKALALPFMSLAWKNVRISKYDRVVVSSHAMAHTLAERASSHGTPAFAYIHSPARYLWAPEHDPRGDGGAKRVAARALRRVDKSHVGGNVRYAANSQFVQRRITDSWSVESRVIYPPVDVERVRTNAHLDPPSELVEIEQELRNGFVLGASRLVDYKRLDVAITVGDQLGVPVVVAGEGPAEPNLRELAETSRVPVHFVGRLPDAALHWLYGAASLFVFTAIEDFGIMPVEAIAAGTPILTNCVGGAAEIVHETGVGAVCDPRLGTDHIIEQARLALESDLSRSWQGVQTFSLEAFNGRLLTWLNQG